MTEKLVNYTFEDMKVSTRTFTATTNLTIDIEDVSKHILVHETEDVRLRGSKGHSMNQALEKIPIGAIVSVNYLGVIRGFNLKPRKKSKRWFRNSLQSSSTQETNCSILKCAETAHFRSQAHYRLNTQCTAFDAYGNILRKQNSIPCQREKNYLHSSYPQCAT